MSITCKNLDHIYGYNTPFEYYALKNVNLKIEKGSFTAIIGQTGSGKSTLIQHINALLLPTSGEIKIDDYIISQNNKPQNLKSLRKKSGLVFQFPEYQLFEETIERDIMFGPMNFGIDENSAKEIAKKSLEMVGLDETYLEKSPFDLSGGQKRRVAIAGILAMDPDILVLDENEVAIDRLKEDDLLIVIGVEEDALSKQSSRCLRKLLRNQGNKLLLSTQLIDQTMLKSFEGILLVSIDHLEMKERRLLFRYLIDMLVSRYFELECA